MSLSTSQSPSPSADSGPELTELSRLAVIEDVRNLKARYLRLLDTQQWADLTALFTPDARFTLASFGDPIVFDTSAEWIAYVMPLLEGGTTVHQVHQGEIDVIDESSASARWAMTDYVVPAPTSGRASFWGHGHYTERYRRIDGSWRIVELTLSRLMLDSPGPFN